MSKYTIAERQEILKIIAEIANQDITVTRKPKPGEIAKELKARGYEYTRYYVSKCMRDNGLR